MKKKKTSFIVLLFAMMVIMLVISGAYRVKQTHLATSEVVLEPKGMEEDGEWKGSYWQVVLLADMNEEYGFITLDNETLEGYISDEKIVATSEITFGIKPLTPFWEHTLIREAVMVHPRAYQGWGNKLSLGSVHGYDETVYAEKFEVVTYKYGEGNWILHTPFEVTVKKNGETIYRDVIDTVGAQDTIIVTNPYDSEEWLQIKDLGKLGTGYGEPSSLDDALLLAGADYIYPLDAKSIISYDATDESFSQYWFGPAKDDEGHYTRWKDGGFPVCVWMDIGGAGQEYVYGVVDAPGVEDVSTVTDWKGKPKPAEYSDLINYLERFYTRRNADVWNQGYFFNETHFRVYMPLASYSSMVSVLVSTELADAVVWRPHVSNVKIETVNPQDLGELEASRNLYVTVKQYGTVEATAQVKFTSNADVVSVYPTVVSIGLAPGESQTVKTEVTNLGADDRTPFTILVEVKDSFTGTVTDTAEVHGTALPRGANASSLTVYTVHAGTGRSLSGITVTVVLGSYEKTLVTMEGKAMFNLEGLTGTAEIYTAETEQYYSATATKQISYGANSVTLELVEKGEELPLPDYSWVLWIAVAAATILTVSVVYKKRRRIFA